MSGLESKRRLLDNAGYVYNFDRMIYVNRAEKKAFSHEFVDDCTKEALEARIAEPTDGQEWRLYFNSQPSAAAKRELEQVLEA